MPSPKKALDLVKTIAENMRKAQINATKMLGLPPDNTPMDRAMAMGFDTPAYHGTNADFSAFEEKTIGKNFPQSEGGGFFFTENPKTASNYSNLGGEGANVLPVILKTDNQIIKKVDSDFLSPIEYYDMQNGWLPSEAKLQNKNIKIKGTKEDELNVIFNPNQIRSRFAAFDPARINENDLLAGVVAAPLGLLDINYTDK